MQSAQAAANALSGEVDVRVVDSRSITRGLGNQVVQAAEAARSGKSADEVVDLLAALGPRTRVYGTLDTLEFLKRGGRIGGAQALLGTMLSIKPIVDLSNGVVEEAGKQRTRKKALLWLKQHLDNEPPVERLNVMHSNAADVGDFVDLIADRFPPADVHVGLIGPVIGTHGGPGLIGIAYQLRA
jgi:DegV family protein with EDD domain